MVQDLHWMVAIAKVRRLCPGSCRRHQWRRRLARKQERERAPQEKTYRINETTAVS
jgi:predicted secreted protein